MRENTSTEWVNKEVDSEGNFNRQKNQFETPFGEGEGKLPVEPALSPFVGTGMPVGAPQCDCKKTSGIGGCDQSRNSRSEETGCAEKRLGIYTGRRRCGSGSWNPLYQ